MPAHIHAAKMLQYAQDAAETGKPWERWQFKSPRGPQEWEEPDGNLSWIPSFEYRRKPDTIKVNGFDVPAPLREAPAHDAPAHDARYWVPYPTSDRWASAHHWVNDGLDNLWLARGLIHLTEDAAVAHAKAMCGIDPNGGA